MFSRFTIMGRHPLFIDEGVIGIIAEKFRVLASGNEAFFEVINDLWRAPIVFVGEVALKGDFHIGRFDGLLGRDTIKGDSGRQFGNPCGADDRYGAPPCKNP